MVKQPMSQAAKDKWEETRKAVNNHKPAPEAERSFDETTEAAALVRANQATALATWYEQNVDAGMEDVANDAGGNFPILKITGGMSNNELANGSRATIGKIYNTESKTEVASLKATFCYIGKYKMPSFNDKNELKLNYIVGGFTEDLNPFILYVHGMALQGFWEFLGKVKKAKMQYKVPLFALKVNIGVGKRYSEGFKRDVEVWDFSVVADDTNVPAIEMDMSKKESFYRSIETFKDRIAAMAGGDDMNSDTDVVKVNQDKKLQNDVQDAMVNDPEWVKGA